MRKTSTCIVLFRSRGPTKVQSQTDTNAPRLSCSAYVRLFFNSGPHRCRSCPGTHWHVDQQSLKLNQTCSVAGQPAPSPEYAHREVCTLPSPHGDLIHANRSHWGSG